MMKTLLISLLLLLASPLLNAQSRSAREEQELLGPVRMARVEAVRTGANGLTGPRVPVFIDVFDEKGNVLHQEAFNQDGSRKWMYDWGHAYDAEGREIKTYYYNAKGSLTNTGVSVYDDKGRVTETTQINPDGSINHIKSFSYDDKRGKVYETFRSPDGTPGSAATRTYEKGRLTEEVFVNFDGSLHHRNTYSYDGHGNQTESMLFKSDGTVSPWFRRSLSYDDRGNVKEAVNYLSNNSIGSKETFSYEFDEHGNWIKRKTSREVFKEGSSSSEQEVTYRTITYF
jgi:hypothetical protein